MNARRPGSRLCGTYALYREIGKTPDGILFRYPARRASAAWLLAVPVSAIALAGLWNVLQVSETRQSWILMTVTWAFFGSLGLLFPAYMIWTLWTHLEIVIDPKSRRFLWLRRTPFGERRTEGDAGKVLGIHYSTHPRINVGFVGIDLGDGTRIDLGQGSPEEARRLADRLRELLQVPVLGG